MQDGDAEEYFHGEVRELATDCTAVWLKYSDDQGRKEEVGEDGVFGTDEFPFYEGHHAANLDSTQDSGARATGAGASARRVLFKAGLPSSLPSARRPSPRADCHNIYRMGLRFRMGVISGVLHIYIPGSVRSNPPQLFR